MLLCFQLLVKSSQSWCSAEPAAMHLLSATFPWHVLHPAFCHCRCVCVCRYYTPGVHHVYFYLPGTQGSRVIARLQRRWMPPSSTWLFPPLTDTHDRGGWVVEWEGHEAQHKSGWMHPAVFVLTAGCYSYDMEARRFAEPGMSALQERAEEWGRQLGQALQWLRSKW